MAKARASGEASETVRDTRGRLVGYRLRRGFVVFEGRTHRALPRGAVVAADDAVVSLLFRGGADLEPVTE